MKFLAPTILALLLAAMVFTENKPDVKFSTAAEQTLTRQKEAVLAEIKTEKDHAWAGEYYTGDGLGVNVSLVIAPRSGFAFEWHGCLGVYDRNYGSVTEKDNRIRLTFTFENERKGFQGLAKEFIPFRWGARHYLVPPEDMVEFCNCVNDGSEPRDRTHGFFLLRRGDEKIEVSGPPAVPNEYRRYLLSEPVEAKIVSVWKSTLRPSVCDWNFKDTKLTIDAGSKQGLLTGMTLHITAPEDAFGSVTVTKVEENRCEVVMTQIDEDEPPPQAGWKLSTRAPWYTPTTDGDSCSQTNE